MFSLCVFLALDCVVVLGLPGCLACFKCENTVCLLCFFGFSVWDQVDIVCEIKLTWRKHTTIENQNNIWNQQNLEPTTIPSPPTNSYGAPLLSCLIMIHLILVVAGSTLSSLSRSSHLRTAIPAMTKTIRCVSWVSQEHFLICSLLSTVACWPGIFNKFIVGLTKSLM